MARSKFIDNRASSDSSKKPKRASSQFSGSEHDISKSGRKKMKVDKDEGHLPIEKKKRKPRQLCNEEGFRMFNVANIVTNPAHRFRIREYIIPRKLVANAVCQLQKSVEVGIAHSIDCHVCLRVLRMFIAKWLALPIEVVPKPTRETMVADGLHGSANLITGAKEYWRSFANPALIDAEEGVPLFTAHSLYTALCKAQSDYDARDTIVLMVATIMNVLCRIREEERRMKAFEEWASPSISSLLEAISSLGHAHRRVLPTTTLVKYLRLPIDLHIDKPGWKDVGFEEFCNDSQLRLPKFLDPTQQCGTSFEYTEEARDYFSRRVKYNDIKPVVWNRTLAKFLMTELFETIVSSHREEEPKMYEVEDFINRNRMTSLVFCKRASSDPNAFLNAKLILDKIKEEEEKEKKEKDNKKNTGFTEIAKWMRECGTLDPSADLTLTTDIVWIRKKEVLIKDESDDLDFMKKYRQRASSDAYHDVDPDELAFCLDYLHKRGNEADRRAMSIKEIEEMLKKIGELAKKYEEDGRPDHLSEREFLNMKRRAAEAMAHVQGHLITKQREIIREKEEKKIKKEEEEAPYGVFTPMENKKTVIVWSDIEEETDEE